jgi:hypothetical protein
MNSSNSNSDKSWSGKRFDLSLGVFDNQEQNLDAFISRFESVARAYELPTNLWSIELSKTLNGISLEVYQHLEAFKEKTMIDL